MVGDTRRLTPAPEAREQPIGNLLVVDDKENNRDFLSRRLSRKGFSVATAESGRQALEMIGAGGFDVVLLDVMMPELDGLTVLKMIRDTHSPTELPVIMVTAKDRSRDVVTALERGANDYVTKPIDFQVVLARVQTQVSLKRTGDELRDSQERYALAFRGANDGLWDWDLKNGTIFFSNRWKAMLGHDENEIGESPDEWMSRVHPAELDSLKAAIDAHFEGVSPTFEQEYRALCKAGEYRWMLGRGVVVRDASGKPTRFAGSQTDITSSKAFDPLTGLPNRLLFSDRLETVLARARRKEAPYFAVVLVYLDRFKVITNSLGAVCGDQLMVAAAKRLEECFRLDDYISRLAGNNHPVSRLRSVEFAILVEGIMDVVTVMRIARRIQNEIGRPYDLDGTEVFTPASIGIALGDKSYESSDEVLRDAGAALDLAREQGQGCCRIFDEKMHHSALAQLRLEADLRKAVKESQLLLYCQPVVNMETLAVVGFEALVRWAHSRHGLLLPASFIPVAEQTGLIDQIGEWVFREACTLHQKWRDAGLPAVNVAVNLSVRQLENPELIQVFSNIIDETGIDPSFIEIELTETVLMRDMKSHAYLFKKLFDMGIKISIDDFGTGYSSFSYLNSLPISFIKIDKSFVGDMLTNSNSRSIVKSTISMSHSLDIQVIAEGIETEAQALILRSLNCERGQGFYFGKPQPPEVFASLLSSSVTEGVLA